jgi:DNA-cytosine methyltransferase
MNVLSLFDGMSCGQQALERIGIKVDNYYASEIDKYAIQVTMANYPNTIQLGSVVNVDGYSLPKIDLLIGGSPCQSFSFAGKRKGMSTKDEQEILTLEHYLQLKSEGFEFEGQSYLFWEYMRLLNEVKPKYFLLENVEMGEKWEKVLSKAIGVNGIHINSTLVSAQNRKRIYWTNIGMRPAGLFGDMQSIIKQPKDKSVLLKDILEIDVDKKYFLSDKMIAGFERHKERHNNKGTGFGYIPKTEIDKGNSLRANAALAPTDNMIIVHNTMPRSSTSGKGGTGPLSRNDGKTYCLDTGNTNAVEIIKSQTEKLLEKTGIDISNIMEPTILDVYNKTLKNDGKCITLTDPCHNNLRLVVPNISVEIVAQRGRGENNVQQLESRNDGKTNSLTSVQKDNLVREIKQLNENQLKKFNPNINSDKANTLTLAQGRAGSSQEYMDSISKIAKLTSRIRRLTPIECERLQTVKDNYTNYVSDSQRYRMLGNGWTISVICHIFSYLPKEYFINKN